MRNRRLWILPLTPTQPPSVSAHCGRSELKPKWKEQKGNGDQELERRGKNKSRGVDGVAVPPRSPSLVERTTSLGRSQEISLVEPVSGPKEPTMHKEQDAGIAEDVTHPVHAKMIRRKLNTAPMTLV